MITIFYTLLNAAYRMLFGRRYMLHTPLFQSQAQTLFEAQTAFVDHCISFLPGLTGKRILDVSCGNGMQTLHILEKFQPSSILGVDVVAQQVNIARRNIPPTDKRIHFEVDDAQELRTVATGSIDVLICLESALHYPDKNKFLRQVTRVLVPGGHLLVADLLVDRESLHNNISKRMYLHNWTHKQYLEAFQRHGISVTADEYLNGLLLARFDQALAAIARELRSVNAFTAFFKLVLVRPVLALYAAQLRNRFEYRVFVGTVSTLHAITPPQPAFAY